jgi:ABC-type uncharacterized transport system substrate-binding protein
MRRRDFIAGLMFTSTMGRAQAQQTGKVFRIAFAHPTTPVADINQASKGSLVIPAIFEELIRLGYVEGRNLLIERYSGEGRAAHYPELVRAVVSRNPDLIIAISNNHPIDEDGYRRVFAAFAQDRAEAFAVSEENENLSNFKLIIELAEKYRLPAIYPFKMCVEGGGLMSYGYDIPAQGRYMANAVAQILKGTKPGDIPVFQPTKFELAINLKTAKALGLTVPPELLATADEVIE